jgi:hypothetical protein
MAIYSGLRIEVRGEGGTSSNMTTGIGFCIYPFKVSGEFDATDAGLAAARLSARSQTANPVRSVPYSRRGLAGPGRSIDRPIPDAMITKLLAWNSAGQNWVSLGPWISRV